MRIDYNYYDADKQISKQISKELDYKFTFETDADLIKAQQKGYISEYDIVRMVVKCDDNGSTVDFPVKSRQEYNELIKLNSNRIIEIYPAVHSYDIYDYE